MLLFYYIKDGVLYYMKPLTEEQTVSMIKKTLLTKEQEKELLKLIAKGNKKAVQDLIEANMFLIKSIVGHYLTNQCSFDLRELIEIGKIGLRKAIKKYNLLKDYKFSTYASWWIRHEIHQKLGIKD